MGRSMSTYGIYGAQLDINGHVLRAIIRQIDPKSKKWSGLPRMWDVNQIARRIASGDTVYGIFTTYDDHMQETFRGPKLKRVVYFRGDVGVDVEANVLGRTVYDLVQHVATHW